LRLRFIAIASTLLLALGANAVPPGSDDEIDARLQPYGSVNRVAAAEVAVAEVPAEPLSGAQVYDTYCATCHAMGIGGAPTFADTAAWAPRIAKGMDALMVSTLNGVNAMPAKGLCMSCSDDELAGAVTHMVDAAR
jgi:cytochrome c5